MLGGVTYERGRVKEEVKKVKMVELPPIQE
jgi:hypothetical protein